MLSKSTGTRFSIKSVLND